MNLSASTSTSPSTSPSTSSLPPSDSDSHSHSQPLSLSDSQTHLTQPARLLDSQPEQVDFILPLYVDRHDRPYLNHSTFQALSLRRFQPQLQPYISFFQFASH